MIDRMKGWDEKYNEEFSADWADSFESQGDDSLKAVNGYTR